MPVQILCCQCAIPIAPNAVNMCAQCLQTRYDIGEGIAKQVQQNTCRGCGRYERRDGSFAPVEPESAELMALLLKKPRGLGAVRLVDASFVWTEPHSRRLKIKACVQKEVVSGAVMQQSFVIEYVLSGHCVDTHVHVPGPPYCAPGLRVPAACVPYVPEAQGSLPLGPHCTVRTPHTYQPRACRASMHRVPWAPQAPLGCGVITSVPWAPQAFINLAEKQLTDAEKALERRRAGDQRNARLEAEKARATERCPLPTCSAHYPPALPTTHLLNSSIT